MHACYAATGLPIVGMGGVMSGRDAIELIACGAVHVALGTVLFADPDAPSRVREELSALDGDDVFASAHETKKTLEFRAKVEA